MEDSAETEKNEGSGGGLQTAECWKPEGSPSKGLSRYNDRDRQRDDGMSSLRDSQDWSVGAALALD